MWVVKHREGTCALKHQRRKKAPPEAVMSVPTLCGHFVILPWGFAGPDEDPTCAACNERIADRLRRDLEKALPGWNEGRP